MLQHLKHQFVLTGMTTWMTSCPPKHDIQHMMFLPLYMNLESEKRQRERQEVDQVMLQHLQHKLVLTGMTTWMTSCPPKPWPSTHDVPPRLHERKSRKERKGKARGSSSHTTPPATPPSVNWDDDLDDFMPWSITYDVHRFKMYSHLVLLMLYYACMYVSYLTCIHWVCT